MGPFRGVDSLQVQAVGPFRGVDSLQGRAIWLPKVYQNKERPVSYGSPALLFWRAAQHVCIYAYHGVDAIPLQQFFTKQSIWGSTLEFYKPRVSTHFYVAT